MILNIEVNRRRGFLGLFVMLFTWCKYDHVEFIATDERWSYGALPGGVHYRPYTKPARAERFTLDVPPETWYFLRRQLDKPYDWRGVLGIVLHMRLSAKPRAWFCADLVDCALRAGGLAVVREDARWVTPRTILEGLREWQRSSLRSGPTSERNSSTVVA